MTKRDAEKAGTFQAILEAGKREFMRTGILAGSTAAVAKAAKIAHGTVFFHFGSKSKLVAAIIDHELMRYSNEVENMFDEKAGVRELLENYLDFLSREEEALSVLLRELPMLPPELQRLVFSRESLMRGHFASLVDKGIAQGRYKKVNVTTAVNLLFGALHHYLRFRHMFAEDGKAISRIRVDLIETFLTLLEK